MKRTFAALAALILLAGLGFGQFPTTVATNADLIVARNGATTTLNGAINSSVTTFVLTSGTLFGNDMTYTIDSEHIFCATLTTNTTSVCTRGYNGSTAASHSNGATVSGFLLAAHHNVLATAIQATQGWLRDGKFNYCASATGNDSYACNLVPPITSYTTGARYLVLVGTANTGGATLALNGLSAITILKQHDQALATGDIEAGTLIEVGYDGTNMQMLSQLSSASGGGDANAVEAPLFCSDAGANDTYTCSLSPAISTYTTGNHYRFVANTANTGAASINLNALGAKTIVKVAGGITTVLADNDIRVGQWVDLVYDGTNMQLQSLLGNAPTGTPGGVSGNVQANISGSFAAATASTMSTPHYCQDAGSTDAYACSVSPAIGLYTTGNHFWFKANTANTGTASINFNAIGARTIVKVAGGITTVLATNDIRAGQWVEVVDDGTNFQMQSTLGNAPSGVSGLTVDGGDASVNASVSLTMPAPSTPTYTAGGTTTCNLATSNACAPTAIATSGTTLALTNPHGSGPYWIKWTQGGTPVATPITYPGTMANCPQPSPTASKVTTFQFIWDGAAYRCLGSDDALDTPVTGPASSTTNNCAKFADTTGKILSDAGAACGGGITPTVRGNYASAATCDGTITGQLYFATDTPGVTRQCNGTSYQDFLENAPITVPGAVSGWTNVNTATLADSGAAALLTKATTGLSLALKAISSTTDFRVKFRILSTPNASDPSECGLFVTNGTTAGTHRAYGTVVGVYVATAAQLNTILTRDYNPINGSIADAGFGTGVAVTLDNVYNLRVVASGTTYTAYTGDGTDWVVVSTGTMGNAATHWGFGCDPRASQTATMKVYSASAQ